MRAYFFGNMYLSSIQQGIQAQHTTAELFVKYTLYGKSTADFIGERQRSSLYDWAKDHKTSILLNGGYADTLRALIARFDSTENPYPWTFFNEGEDALDGALTCVGIILPAKIYELASAMRADKDLVEVVRNTGVWAYDYEETVEFSKWEFELCVELNNYGLAS